MGAVSKFSQMEEWVGLNGDELTDPRVWSRFFNTFTANDKIARLLSCVGAPPYHLQPSVFGGCVVSAKSY